MLAEKFFLFLETLLSYPNIAAAAYPDGSPKIVSASRFTPIRLTPFDDQPRSTSPYERPRTGGIPSNKKRAFDGEWRHSTASRETRGRRANPSASRQTPTL